MWILTIHYPGKKVREYPVRPGSTTVGRKLDNDVVLPDTSVSRRHAQITYCTDTDGISIQDMGSFNGTYVNLQRIDPNKRFRLRPNDQVHIGIHELRVEYSNGADRKTDTESQLVTRHLPHDVLDHRAALMYAVAQQLNTVLDVGSALKTASALMKDSMGADRCEVIHAGRFGQLREHGFSETIASMALNQGRSVLIPSTTEWPDRNLSQSAGRLLIYSALCVPVMIEDAVAALIYMYKTDPDAVPFDLGDVQLAEAIGHMIALTLERMSLSKRVTEEQKFRRLLQSYLAPARVDDLLQNYLRTGRLPGLMEESATVLFSDIVDSTGLAERLGARQFGETLKRYYQDMTQIVFDHNGLLDKYLGDGVMAIFGLTAENDEPEESAVNAGLAMLRFVDDHYGSGRARIKIGVGVNSGPVVAGYVRTKDRVEFTILGDTVNVAFGLQALARPNRLFIGPTTGGVINGRFHTREIGSTTIKGREEAVKVHEVLCM